MPQHLIRIMPANLHSLYRVMASCAVALVRAAGFGGACLTDTCLCLSEVHLFHSLHPAPRPSCRWQRAVPLQLLDVAFSCRVRCDCATMFDICDYIACMCQDCVNCSSARMLDLINCMTPWRPLWPWCGLQVLGVHARQIHTCPCLAWNFSNTAPRTKA